MESGRMDGRWLVGFFVRKSVTRVEEGKGRNRIP